MNKAVAGIDPSLTGTAVVLWDGEMQRSHVFGSAPSGPLLASRMVRYNELIGRVHEVLIKARPEVVAVEGCYVGRSTAATQQIIEYGALLRRWLMLVVHRWRVVEVPPGKLKKFVAGSGNASKLQVAAAIIKRWGVEYKTDDEYDAFGLALIASAVAGTLEMNRVQREIVEELKKTVC